ncbi:MAG: hypothetical protein A2896_01005 [Candidatus Nealsonbacteria bacterium RIFCSPLOWO2_01_FULL_43_32]|uniref:Uncharacterized protein n=1 Tax=Candidatus Nealsonbacteria bacterium RIFCSPLOWO2_01_FULL_43_32 TaxID=1801672 RepID=A0A1G2EEG3_9BACT|nr:MAG: hypothetical protein A2896_01005 [Candidatus Nealsonbacteria bacterium RIFCSPLOWO2_01_FULL_43_32]
MPSRKARKNQEKAEFSAFIKVLKSKGFEFEVFDQGKIKHHLSRGLYQKVEEVLARVNPKEVLIFVFREKDPQFCWLPKSKIYSGSIVINLAHFPGDTALVAISKLKEAAVL